MLIRRITATIGLLAFAVTIMGGTISNNSLEFTLTRALWALLGFCGVGAVLGWAAQRVVREHQAEQHEEVFGESEASQIEAEAAPDDDEIIEALPASG